MIPTERIKQILTGGSAVDQTFAKFDVSNNGVLDGIELQQCLTNVIQLPTLRPFSAKTVQYFLNKHGKITANLGLCIDLPNFRLLIIDIETMLAKFRQLDVDNSGALCCLKLHLAFQIDNLATDPKTVRRLGAKYDIDGNGVLEFDEFCQFLVEWEEYAKVFKELDADKNGRISVSELHAMLANMQAGFWVNQWRTKNPFSEHTCFLLLRKFAAPDEDFSGGPSVIPQLGFAHFGELLMYLIELREKFNALDSNNDGALSIIELLPLLSVIAAESPTESSLLRIGRLYDKNRDGLLEFDEFCQFVIEWESYLETYKKHADPMTGLTSEGLQNILGNTTVDSYILVDDANRRGSRGGYLFEGTKLMRDFSLKTCRTVIAKFSGGRTSLSVLEYMDAIEYLKRLKILFNENDLLTNGVLGISEIGRAFSVSGLNISTQALLNIMSSYTCDHVNKGTEHASLHFDSFVQLRIEIEIYTGLFAARADPSGVAHLQFEQLLDIIYAVPRECRDETF